MPLFRFESTTEIKKSPAGFESENQRFKQLEETTDCGIKNSRNHRKFAERLPAQIDNEDRERVFGRFVRLDESRTKPGNGLGLSLVASVMTLHSGQIELKDNQPGLRVVLRLPLYTEAS